MHLARAEPAWLPGAMRISKWAGASHFDGAGRNDRVKTSHLRSSPVSQPTSPLVGSAFSNPYRDLDRCAFEAEFFAQPPLDESAVAGL
jgi:hypothetical protein